MEETEVPQELRDALRQAFFKTADWMRNKADPLPTLPPRERAKKDDAPQQSAC
jgi:hypothetical protein